MLADHLMEETAVTYPIIKSLLIDFSDAMEEQNEPIGVPTESIQALSQSLENGNSSLAGDNLQKSVHESNVEEQARRAQEGIKSFDAEWNYHSMKDPFQNF